MPHLVNLKPTFLNLYEHISLTLSTKDDAMDNVLAAVLGSAILLPFVASYIPVILVPTLAFVPLIANIAAERKLAVSIPSPSSSISSEMDSSRHPWQ